MRGPGQLPVAFAVVNINIDCEPDHLPGYPPVIWYQPSQAGQPSEALWVFNIPENWSAEIEGWKKKKYDDKGYLEGDKREKLLKEKYVFTGGEKVKNSGKVRQRPPYPNGKDPIWGYNIKIWENENQRGEPRCNKDPGFCIRGGGGTTCEQYFTSP